jgi:hypothetical protein
VLREQYDKTQFLGTLEKTKGKQRSKGKTGEKQTQTDNKRLGHTVVPASRTHITVLSVLTAKTYLSREK